MGVDEEDPLFLQVMIISPGHQDPHGIAVFRDASKREELLVACIEGRLASHQLCGICIRQIDLCMCQHVGCSKASAEGSSTDFI